MKVAIDLAKSGDGSIVNAAVIVDPSVKKIITSGCDQIYSWCNKTTNGNCHFQNPASDTSNPNFNIISNHETMYPNTSHDKPHRSYVGVSCLNPWQWSGKQLDVTNSFHWHPLRHAAIVAIESSAERDRRLFPGLVQAENKAFEIKPMLSSGASAKRQKMNLAKVEKGNELDAYNEVSFSSMKPYLCTGYDIYLVWEPCTMCAMALVHQRIRRIFYAFPNQNAGHRLQGEKSLNHHYAVFRVVVPENVLNVV